MKEVTENIVKRKPWIHISKYNGFSKLVDSLSIIQHLGKSNFNIPPIGEGEVKSFFEDIGFLKKLDSDFVGLATPIIPKRWSDISLYTISFGHGIAITPLHLAVGVSAMVNGGNLVRPSFLKMDDQIIAKKIKGTIINL